MGWNTDQAPLNYLRRRVIYLKKKRGYTRNLIKDELLLAKYGSEKLTLLVAHAVQNIERRIKQFEKAIKKLKS
jgi:hypothetical protein